MNNNTLQVVDQLARKLDAAGIRYCHLKSSHDPGATPAGHGDLDLLVSREDSLKVSIILADSGFRQYVAPAWRLFHGVAGFIGFDETAGIIVHVRTNYRLIVGAPGIQEYRLPWEESILDSVVSSPDGSSLPVPSAEAEMLLLLVRSCLDSRLNNSFFRTTIDKTAIANLERNRARLCDRIDESKLVALNEQWLHPDIWRLVKDATFSPCDRRTILRLSKRLAESMAEFRTYGPMESFLRAWLKALATVFDSVTRRPLKWVRPGVPTTSRSGAIICILGADGSGKSTLTSELDRWLTGQLGVLRIYMGSGDGPSSILRLPLKLLRSAIPDRFLRKKNGAKNTRVVLVAHGPAGVGSGFGFRKKRQSDRSSQSRQPRNDCHCRSLSAGSDIRFQRWSPLAGFRCLAHRMDQSDRGLGAQRLSASRSNCAGSSDQTRRSSGCSHIPQAGYALRRDCPAQRSCGKPNLSGRNRDCDHFSRPADNRCNTTGEESGMGRRLISERVRRWQYPESAESVFPNFAVAGETVRSFPCIAGEWPSSIINVREALQCVI